MSSRLRKPALQSVRVELAGRVLGEFVVREKIGAGGFGEVYRAEQPVLEREAVVKVARAVNGEESVRRFLREAQLASRLDHPYAAHVYAFGAEQDGLLWIAMELVRGTTLARLLDTQGPLPLVRFVPLFERLCVVVHDAHEQGIVHRDIKPQNVMVMNRAGRLLPKLLDLGIARLAGGDPGDVRPAVGSPHYMAPEEWREGRPVDRRADVYALGVLAYESLTGRRPFDAATLEEIAGAHARAPVPPLGEDFSAALDAWLARSLAKTPDERPDTALALADGLRAAAGLASEVESLPGLDPALREQWTARAPQPLAEAVAALEAARNPHQAWDAAGVLIGTLVRWLALLALACRGRAPRARDGEPVGQRLRQLRRSGLDDAGWIALARELVRPFAAARDSHPLPDLVRSLLDEERGLFDEPLAVTRPAPPGEAILLGQLGSALAVIDRLMRALGFLLDHPLAVVRGARAERWIGVRRKRRVTLPMAGRLAAPDGTAVLLDADGAVVVSLAPLVQIAAPAPGADEECFLLDGAGALGARLTAWPYGFERQDEQPWSWFAATFVGEGEEALPTSVGARAPWPGLAAFTGADAALYCGREREVEAFANRLRAQPLLAVVGPSGAGKSSFIQAGVLPALSATWSELTLRPGPRPMVALAARLRRSGIAAEPDGGSPEQIGAALRAAAEKSGPIVLVVDQFEEVFTLCRDPAERDRFAAALAGAARSVDDPLRVLLTLRDDFLVRCERLAPLRHRLTHGLAVLATPAPGDLRRILVEPAARAGYEFDDPELPDRMVAEVAGEEGALVLLSFTAAKLWELRDRQFRQLRARSFDSLGGVGGALARHAETVLAGLTSAGQRTAREAFRHLATAEGTRSVLGRDELIDMLGEEARPVLDRLVADRLLTASESETGEDRIEIVHEALLAAWPRLVEWRREDTEGARFRDQIRSAAAQWAERGRPRGLLLRGEALVEYQLWRARFPGPLPATAEEFAGASQDEAARGRRMRTGALAAVLITLVAGVVFLYRASGREESQRRRAEDRLVQFYAEQGRQALLAGHPLEGSVYLNAAYQRGEDGAAMRVMMADAARPLEAEILRLPGHTGRVWSAEYDPAGERIVTASDDGAVRIFRADGRVERVLGGHAGRVLHARFAGGGRLILSSSADGTARLFEAASGAERSVFAAGGEVLDAALAPDGRTLATASWTGGDVGEVRLWDVATGAARCTVDVRGIVVAVAFAPASDLVAAAGGDGTARVWEVATCRERVIVRHAAHVQHVSFDAGGHLLLTASWDGTARISDATTGEPKVVLVGHSDKVEQAAFSPDGRRVVTASRDATARVWDAGSGRLLSVLVGHTGPVNAAAFDASGRRLVTASSDASARIWDAGTGRQLAALHGHAGVILTAAFDSSGDRVVTASWDGTARLWNASEQAGLARTLAPPAPSARRFAIDAGGQLALGRGDRVEIRSARDGALVASLAGAAMPIRSVAISPSGDRVMAASREGRARVWDLARREIIASFDWPDGLDVSPLLAAHAPPLLAAPHPWLATGISALALTGDAYRVAIGETNGHIAVWDPARPRALAATGAHAGTVDALAYAPDGGRLATIGGTIPVARIWDAETLSPIAELSGHTGRILDVEFSHRGDRLVTASVDGTARVWNAAGGLLGALEGHADFVTSVAISADDQLIATGSGDGTIRLWDASSYRMIGVRDARAGFVFDVAFSPDGERVLSLDASGALLSWDVHRERKSPAEIAALVACRVPFRLDEATGRLLPVTPAEVERQCAR